MGDRFEQRVKMLGAGIRGVIAMMPEQERTQLLEQLAEERTQLDEGTGELAGIKMVVDALLEVAG